MPSAKRFDTVPFQLVPTPQPQPFIAPAGIISNVQSFSTAGGARGLKSDRQGMWFGAENFADAPWKVDPDGNMTATTLTGGGVDGYVQVDGPNKRILVHDGENPRILIGYDEDGF